MQRKQETLGMAIRRAEPYSYEWVKLNSQIWEIAALLDELSEESLYKVRELIALLKSCDDIKEGAKE